jgi:uncharacterized delta-60 repeat protein
MKFMGILGAVVVTAASLAGCGDDDEPGGTGATGGQAGSSGRGGSTGRGGSAGASGSAGSAGTAGSAGSGGSAGVDAGTGGTAGTAGTGGGDAGDGGPITYWGDGTKGTPISATADDRLWGVAFHNNTIYAVGYVDDAGNKKMVVAKYNTNAELDTTWGTNQGLTYVDASPYAGSVDDAGPPDPSIEEARDVVVQSDGKIVVVGRAEDPSVTAPTRTTASDLVFFRLTTTGQLDTTFGTQGKTVVSLGNTPDDQVWGLDIDAQNRVYAFASGQTSDTTRTDADRYVVRLTDGGVLDTTFATTGKATFDVPQGSLTGTAPVTLKLNDNQRHGFVLSNGSVISSGYTNVAGRNQVVLAKFTTAGVLDTTFSGDGIVRLAPFPLGMAEAYGVAFQTDGKLVTTGYGRVDLDSTTRDDVDLVSFRVNAAGDFDSTWGVGGSFVYDIINEEERGRYVFALSDDRIMMVGAGRATPTNKDAMLLLLDKNGAPVPNFSQTKHKLYEFDGENDEFYAAAMSGDKKLIAAVGYATGGSLTNGNSTLVVLPVGE